MKHKFLTLLFPVILFVVFFAVSTFLPTSAQAFDSSKCTYTGQCVDNMKCYSPCGGRCGVWVSNGPCGSAVVGGIKPPEGVLEYNTETMMQGGGGNSIGIFAFLSVALRLFTIICGLFMFFNFLWAGYALITRAGDSKAFSDVRERLQYALIGLVIIVAAYMISAIFGLLFFGDAGFILQPNIAMFGAIAP